MTIDSRFCEHEIVEVPRVKDGIALRVKNSPYLWRVIIPKRVKEQSQEETYNIITHYNFCNHSLN